MLDLQYQKTNINIRHLFPINDEIFPHDYLLLIDLFPKIIKLNKL